MQKTFRLSYDEQITSVASTRIAELYPITRVEHILDKRTLTYIINAQPRPQAL